MKKLGILLFSLSLFLLLNSCKKKDNNTADVRYEFTSDISAAYKIEYVSSKDAFSSVTINSDNWKSQTFKILKEEDTFAPNIVRINVYPPQAWVNSNTQANINLKIYVDGELMQDSDHVLSGADFEIGVFDIVSF
ncbi:MAG: hypothetical protein ABI390_09565 [Daejeonella sp.]